MNLLGFLVDKGKLAPSARAAVELHLAKKTKSLADALVEQGVKLEEVLQEVGKEYGFPTKILGDPPVSEQALDYIPRDSAQHYEIVPLAVNDGALEVGLVDPDNIEAFDALQFISTRIGMPYKIFLITKEDFDRVLDSYQNLSGEVGKALSEFETEGKRVPEGNSPKLASLTEEAIPILEEKLTLTGPHEAIKEDAPVTKIVSTMLRYAIEGHSSDIHVEPLRAKTRVRFRVDGDLHTSIELPSNVHEAVVARIKILAKLRLDEKRKPQDGRFSATVDARKIDFRVSTFPTENGEKVVMRILDQSDTSATLESVGFSGEHLDSLRAMLKAPYGIILIAGPTGSGKSTTLFALLSELDRETENVVTLEDPVEYQIANVSQSQVRPEIGYTFASGLRSILRQDPDVIMVGEIRDKETAALAVQAALTGHLVFSTIHTNTASGAIPRLIDMGVDPFLVAPTLIGVIGQRLVRKFCSTESSKPYPISDSMKLSLEQQFSDLPKEYHAKLPEFKEFYTVSPTVECPNGTRGRTAVFEILRMNKDLEQVILKEPIEERIYEAGRKNGMLTMRESAIIKALSREIPFEEINTLGGDLFPDITADAQASV